MKKPLFSVGVAIAACLLPLEAQAASFSGLYVFGDSLSDTGNVLVSTGGLFPTTPYAPGRFSNGPIWIDYLAESLGVTPAPITQVLLGTASPVGGINFAYGGATTGIRNVSDPLLPIPPGPIFLGLQEQISLFDALIPPNQLIDPNALYVVWAGANDYIPSFSDPGFQPATTPDVPVANIAGAISSLAAQGARNFLVPNLPDLGKTPYILNNSVAPQLAAFSPILTQRSNAFNAALASQLQQLDATLPDVSITLLDVNSLVDQLLSSSFGFTVVDQPCFNAIAGTVCSNPDSFLFWDLNHPTAAGHRLVGELAIASLNDNDGENPPQSVPEPGIILGLLAIAGLGISTRQQRAVK